MYKYAYPLAVFVAAFTLNAASSPILIDGTAIDGYLLNGSFESPGGGGDAAPDSWTFIPDNSSATSETPQVVARDNNASDGDYSVFVGYDDNTLDYTAAVDTFQTGGYVIALGDVYELSFDHIGLAGWSDGFKLRYSLFYTADDTLSGVSYNWKADVGASNAGSISGATVLTSDLVSVDKDSYGSTGTISSNAVADAGAVGKHLWLAFTTAEGERQFARVDQVSLAVIPEPSTLAYASAIALCALGMIIRRRV